MKRKAIFFDRDGIVNMRPVGDYIKSIDEFHFLPDFLEFLPIIKAKGYLAILISNQQGVGKGLMSESDLAFINEYMQNDLFIRLGINFDDTYYSTALAADNSPNRKPQPGMLLEAIKNWNIAPEESWMIGDSVNDILAGVKTIFITNEPVPDNIQPDIVCNSLPDIKI